MANQPDEQLAVVLIGHGSPATDCPPELVGELMSLEWRPKSGPHGHHDPKGRAAELDEKIRAWPRHAGNDPYKVGLERVAEVLRPLLPTPHFAIGYNEFCKPSIAQAVEEVIRQGARRVLVIPSMLTPGGVHAEIDIPRTLEGLRRRHPTVAIDYLWPFHLDQVAAELSYPIEDGVHPDPFSLLEGIRGVAPPAPEVTGGQPDEGAGASRERGLPLYAVEDLGDLKIHAAPHWLGNLDAFRNASIIGPGLQTCKVGRPGRRPRGPPRRSEPPGQEDAADGIGQMLGGGIPIGGVLRQGLEADRLGVLAHLRANLSGGNRSHP